MTATDAVSTDIAAMLFACSTYRSWAEQEEGPYRRDTQREPPDEVEDRAGVQLQLGIGLLDEPGAIVEIWQCDALGRYSGFPPPDDTTLVTAETAPRTTYLSDQSFLRGRQRCDSDGMVEFRTIYPGWYPGRTVHIHLMVHTGGRLLTSQLYFPEHINNAVLAGAPYAGRPGRDTTNERDEIFATGGGPAMLDIVELRDGYRAGICLAVPT